MHMQWKNLSKCLKKGTSALIILIRHSCNNILYLRLSIYFLAFFIVGVLIFLRITVVVFVIIDVYD